MILKYLQFVQCPAVSESISFLGPKIWNVLPDKIKQHTSLNSFKNQLKNGSRKIAHKHCAKFILMVLVSFLSCHKYTWIYCVSFSFFIFYRAEIELSTFSTLLPEMTMLC